MATVFLTTAFTWCLTVGTSIICNYGRASETTKTIATTAAVSLGIIVYIWAVTWVVVTLAG